jgi:hypothetical protein
MSIKPKNPRIHCADGVSLSVQANSGAYCEPRIDDVPTWRDYESVEVGFIEDEGGEQLTPPEEWAEHGEMGYPSDVYAWIPVIKVERFIAEHGGVNQPSTKGKTE